MPGSVSFSALLFQVSPDPIGGLHNITVCVDLGYRVLGDLLWHIVYNVFQLHRILSVSMLTWCGLAFKMGTWFGSIDVDMPVTTLLMGRERGWTGLVMWHVGLL